MKEIARKFLVSAFSAFTFPWFWLWKKKPSAVGFVFRESCWRKRLKRCGSPVWFYRNVKIVHPENVSIGNRCTFEEHVILQTESSGDEIVIGENVHIRSQTILLAGGGSTGKIDIGTSTLISSHCTFLGGGGISIGKNVLISPGVVLTSVQHNFDRKDVPIVQQGFHLKEIIIEDDVYLGSNVVVCPGVRIRKGSVIGAGAVVVNDIPTYSIAVGIPARVIKQRG